MENSIEFVAYSRKLLRTLNRIRIALSESDSDTAKKLVNELIEDTKQDIESDNNVKTIINVKQELTAESVLEAVGEYYGVTSEAIISKDRSSAAVRARQIAMYILNSTNMSLTEIGSHLGGRDHSTIVHAVNKIKDEIEIDNQLKQQINEIKGLLSEKGYNI